MFKEYMDFNSRGQQAGTQVRVGVDLMSIVGYWRSPADGRVQLRLTANIVYDTYMTQAEFDEFTVNLKTANRLKKVYD